MSLPVSGPWSTSGVLTGDTLVRTGAGLLHSVVFSCADAAPTAGSCDIRDGVAAAGGTVLLNVNFTTTPFLPVQVILDVPFSTGLYVDMTTTADVNVVCLYSGTNVAGNL